MSTSTARALFPCRGEDASELSFDAGDVLVDVRPASQDGWFSGTLWRTGSTGLFPQTHVEFVPADEPSQPTQPPPPPGTTDDHQPQLPPWISADEWQKWHSLFKQHDTDQDGRLSGAQVARIYSMSKLATATLASVWDLCCTGQPSTMTAREFVCGMCLLTAELRRQTTDGGQQSSLPRQLDPVTRAWLTADNDLNKPSSASVTPAVRKLAPTPPVRRPSPSLSNSSSASRTPAPPPARFSNVTIKANSDDSPQPQQQPPSQFDMLKFGASAEGQQVGRDAATVAKSDAGRQAGALAWQHRDTLKAAAQSPAGKAAAATAWQNRGQVGKGLSAAAGALPSNKK